MPASGAKPVVIVEDDSSMRQALDRILRLKGFRPVVYPTAETLLAAQGTVEEQEGVARAGCLILDIQLPGMNGFALRDRLATLLTLPPVIFITAFDDPEARARAARVGASAFLAKPFSGRSLLEEVARALGSPVTP